MRILLACPYAWDVAGGVQTHVRELANALATRGHDVAVVAPARRRAAIARRPSARVRDGHPATHLVGRAVAVPWGGGVAQLCPSHGSARRIRSIMRAFRPDVVHVHEPLVPSTAMLATLVANAPVVATFHAFNEGSRIMRSTAPLLRVVCRRIAAPIAVSSTAAAYAGLVLRDPITIVPNGVDAARFQHPPVRAAGVPRGRVILWVHRLEKRKGFAVALRAFAQLAAEMDDVRMVVIGDGTERRARATIPVAVQRRVTMLGQIDNEDLPPHHATADVFIAPAIGQESFGIALVEAMAAGVPVVASDIRGYRHVVRPGLDGLLVPPGDAAALAAALRRVLTDDGLSTALARAGRTRARRFDWDVVFPQLDAIYRRVAGAGERRPRTAVNAE